MLKYLINNIILITKQLFDRKINILSNTNNEQHYSMLSANKINKSHSITIIE